MECLNFKNILIMTNKAINDFLGKKNGMLTKKYFSLKSDIQRVLSNLIDKGVTDLGVTYCGRVISLGQEKRIKFNSLIRESNGDIFLYDKNNNIGYLSSLLLLDEQMGLIENLLSRTFRDTPLSEPEEERTVFLTIMEEDKNKDTVNMVGKIE